MRKTNTLSLFPDYDVPRPAPSPTKPSSSNRQDFRIRDNVEGNTEKFADRPTDRPTETDQPADQPASKPTFISSSRVPAPPSYVATPTTAVILLFQTPYVTELLAAGTYREQLFVSADLQLVRVGGAVYEIPDIINIRFDRGKTGRSNGAVAPAVPCVRLTANRFHDLCEAFDESPAADDPVMRGRMERISEEYWKLPRVWAEA